MNHKTIILTVIAPLLELALACGGGGGDSTATPPVAVVFATPILTAPRYLAAGGETITISTQAQPDCIYAWTLFGESTAKIATGQGTSTITD
jgi:hypothetical protein